MHNSPNFSRLPKILYKYVSADRGLKIIRNRTVRFTPPSEFNDPFEFCPTLDLASIKEAYLRLPHCQAAVRQGVARAELMRGFQRFCLGVAHVISERTSATGVLCLSERPDIPLMWSHYAANHTGFVIGIDATTLCSSAPPDDKQGIYGSGAVNYRQARGQFSAPSQIDFMFTKDICWGYEREWRIVRGLMSLRAVNPTVHVSEFPAAAIREVFSGAFTTLKHRNAMAKLLKRKVYRGVSSFALTIDSHGFELDIQTAIGNGLDRQELEFEIREHPAHGPLYRYTSRGAMFQAMELIAAEQNLGMEKHHLGF